MRVRIGREQDGILAVLLALPLFKRQKIKNFKSADRDVATKINFTQWHLTRLDKNSRNLKNQEMNKGIDYRDNAVIKIVSK